MKPYNVPDVPVRNLHGGRAWGAPASLVIQNSFDLNLTSLFPADIKAINYFDDPGQYDLNGAPCKWNFSAAGLSAWEALGNDSKFSPMVPGT
jgi:hypothetical protein